MSLDTIKFTEYQVGEGQDQDTIRRYTPDTRRGGAWVRFGLDEFRLPALGLAEVQELEPDVHALEGLQSGASPSAEQWKSAHRIIWASMRRNYTTLELNDVIGLVDLSNVKQVLEAIFGTSGYKKVAPGEA